MKKYLFGSLALIVAVGLSSFTNKKAHKPFTQVSYFYFDGAGFQRIEANDNTTSTNSYKKSMNLDPNHNTANAEVRKIANWSTDPLDCSTADYDAVVNDGSRYLKSFTIPNEDANSNGTSASDNAVSFAEVVAELQAQHVASGEAALPVSLQVGSIGFKVTVPITKGETFH